ncbi:MAG: NACHT domain-containing protein [Candidatus Omnitrophota bacterium]
MTNQNEELNMLHGILAMVDIVNFTGQATKLGDTYTALYTSYFQGKVKQFTDRYGFDVVKPLGDAVLIFGTDPEGLLNIMLDLFDRDKPENKHGFISRFRMVAHSGYFQFKMENGKPVDLISPEGIKVFRMEKLAESWEMVVTGALYQGIKPLLTPKYIEAVRIPITEPLKGFDSEEWYPPFFRLKIIKDQSGVSNLLEKRMNELEEEVRFIPVFGNIYPPVPMHRNFINLSLVCDDDKAFDANMKGLDNDDECTRDKRMKSYARDIRGEFPFHESNKKLPDRLNRLDVSALYDRFPKGIIFGLPGAGKTTILRHIAFKEFKQNESLNDDKKRIVLFIPCRDVPFYDDWYKKRYGGEPENPSWERALEFMTWVFLFGPKNATDIPPQALVEFQSAELKVRRAFKEKHLTLLVDALDEASTDDTRNRITRLFNALYSDNRLYLTSRPSERTHLKPKFTGQPIPVFNVLSLDMEQVRDVARHLMEEDSSIYKKFDDAIWKEEVVVKMAATPITALLVTAYFQAYERFEHRYPMYDLLLKFILLKVWDDVKTGAFKFENMELFFEEIKKVDFFDRHKETKTLYNALAALCFDLFYESADGTVQRSVSEWNLMSYFTKFIRERDHYYSEQNAVAEAEKWKDRFHNDHLLLRSGARDYVFVHSTVMEYLAAYYMVEERNRDVKKFPEMVAMSLANENFLELETVSIAAGSNLLTGYHLLRVMKDMKVKYDRDLLNGQALKCLAEVEWGLEKTLLGIQFKSLLKPVMNMVDQNRDAVKWVYLYLKGILLSRDPEQLKKARESFEASLKLSRPTFLNDYMDDKAFDEGDSGLIELRKEVLLKLVQKDVVDYWLKDHTKKGTQGAGIPIVDRVLQLDSPVYHPEDKNFSYYQKLIGSELKGFFGSPNLKHSGAVRACAFSPDGTTVLSASDDHTLKLWDSGTGREIHTLTGHKDIVWGCAFSPDGRTVLSASSDRTLKLWNAGTGREIRTFSGHTNWVYACAFSPDGTTVLSASWDHTLKLWDTETGREIRTLIGHNDSVLGCTFSPDGTTVLSASRDHTVKLWGTRTGREIRTFTGHTYSVNDCAFSPDGTTVLSASDDQTLKLWDAQTGREVRTLKTHKYSVLDCMFSPDGRTVLSASDDQTLKLWDVGTGMEIRTFTGHQAAVNGCAFSPDGTTVLSASRDYNVKLWDAQMGRDIRAFSGHNYSINDCAFSPDGTTMLSASDDQTLKLWDAQTGREIRTFTGHKEYVWTCAFSPDGTTVLSASFDILKLWDTQTGREIRTFTGHKESVWSCAFSPDGRTVLSASFDKTLKLWDAQTGREIRTFTGHKESVWICAFSPDGTTVLSASFDDTLKLWDAGTGLEIRTFSGHQAVVNGCAFSPDGRAVLSASEDKTLKLWDTGTGREIRTFSGHNYGVKDCAFSPDGRSVLSASSDNTLKLWNVETGRCIKTLELPWISRSIFISPGSAGLPANVLTANRNGTVTMFQFEEIH